MSVENVKAFFKKIEEDESFRKEVLKAPTPKSADEKTTRLQKIAADAGFEFTGEDLTKAQLDLKKELTEDDLEKVAGGGVGIGAVATTDGDSGGVCLIVGYTWE
jgi:predicted ribosomally synthesized peptide with nif11-like leader